MSCEGESFFNSLFAQKLYNFLELLKKKWVNKLFVSRIREGEFIFCEGGFEKREGVFWQERKALQFF